MFVKRNAAAFFAQSEHAAEEHRKALDAARAAGYDVFQDCITIKSTDELLSSMDFGNMEARLIADLVGPSLDNGWEVAALLPRDHPMRFALLYGAGSRKLGDWALSVLAPKEMALEADIREFENWQSGATAELHTAHTRENAAIAYAAVEAGAVSPDTGMKAVRAVNALSGTVSGRFTAHKPNFKYIDRNGKVYEMESDMERARR